MIDCQKDIVCIAPAEVRREIKMVFEFICLNRLIAFTDVQPLDQADVLEPYNIIEAKELNKTLWI